MTIEIDDAALAAHNLVESAWVETRHGSGRATVAVRTGGIARWPCGDAAALETHRQRADERRAASIHDEGGAAVSRARRQAARDRAAASHLAGACLAVAQAGRAGGNRPYHRRRPGECARGSRGGA